MGQCKKVSCKEIPDMTACQSSNRLPVMPLTARQSDLEWLKRVSEGDRDVPPFNVSRLIALGFVEKSDGSALHVTERGTEILARDKRRSREGGNPV
jgi:hypothetical protein